MIQYIACDIRRIMLDSGYVNTHFDWASRVQRGDMTFYSQYEAGGGYVSIFDNDVGGNSYLRKNGKITTRPTTNKLFAKKTKSCGQPMFEDHTTPLRLVAVVPKSKLGDDAFSQDLLAENLVSLISDDASLAVDGVQSVSYNVQDWDTDSLSIWNAEVQGCKYQMLFDLAYIAINFNCVITLNPTCITNECPIY